MNWVASLACKCYESCFSQCVCLFWLFLSGRPRSLLISLHRLRLLHAAFVSCDLVDGLLLIFINYGLFLLLLLLLLLLFVVLILLDLLLFSGAGHLAHSHVVFGLFVDRLHVVSRRQHLVLA